MKELIIIICVALVLLAIVIIVREVKKALKGRCCEGCSSCNLKEQCSAHKNTQK